MDSRGLDSHPTRRRQKVTTLTPPRDFPESTSWVPGNQVQLYFPRGGEYLSEGVSTGILSTDGIITRTSWLIPLACHTTRGTPSASGTGSILNDSRMRVPDRQIVPARCEYRIRRVTIRTNRSRILSLKSRRY